MTDALPRTTDTDGLSGPAGRRCGARVAVLIATFLLAACSPTSPKPVDTASALLASAVQGRGAAVSFVESEAEYADYTGQRIGPDRTAKTLAAEASGRMAVTLRGPSDQIEFTLVRPANAITVRYSVPDGQEGSLTIDGIQIPLTSKYGWYYGGFPFSNDPADGNPHHFYDHARGLLKRDLPAGAKVVLKCTCTIDLADFELVEPPSPQPAGSVSIVDYGADPTGAKDSSDAIDQALAASADVWIPAGTFTVTRHIMVENTKLRGAFAIMGEVTERDDSAQVNGVGVRMGNGSVVERLFIQHTKVGMWFDGPFDGLTVRGNRIVDVTADGLNLHQGISNAIVEHNLVRNIGDNGLAMWSDQNPNHDNVFRNNTIQMPLLANGIGIYGGHDNQVVGNVVADIQIEGAGIQVANRFSGTVPLDGVTTLADNTILRGGSRFAALGADVGAIFLYGQAGPITGRIQLLGNHIMDSSYSGLHLFALRIGDAGVNNVHGGHSDPDHGRGHCRQQPD